MLRYHLWTNCILVTINSCAIYLLLDDIKHLKTKIERIDKTVGYITKGDYDLFRAMCTKDTDVDTIRTSINNRYK